MYAGALLIVTVMYACIYLSGRTALHRATSSSHVAVASELLKWGADCNAQNVEGSTPLHKAVIIGSYKVTTTQYALTL